MLKVDGLDGEKVNIAVFAIVFGAFGAGQASAYGPDASKGKRAAIKIFRVTETPSQINAMDDAPEDAHQVTEAFRGEICFHDVWFRYPTRPNQWIFKGLTLKINPMDNIAIVGESGQGKSTFILLLLRFYEPEAGLITIDGVDIK